MPTNHDHDHCTPCNDYDNCPNDYDIHFHGDFATLYHHYPAVNDHDAAGSADPTNVDHSTHAHHNAAGHVLICPDDNCIAASINADYTAVNYLPSVDHYFGSADHPPAYGS